MRRRLCSLILDTDGALRRASPAGFSVIPSTFYDNAVTRPAARRFTGWIWMGRSRCCTIMPTSALLFCIMNIDRGKTGLILDVDTADQVESTNIEVDGAGNVLKRWNLAEIISDVMTAGGDDPSEFVFPAPDDWFHNNATTYRRADDTLLVSSRENFVVALDYETGTIKWILGDTTKKWHQFPSLAAYSLDLGPDTLPPIGEHALSITYDEHLLLFDNGFNSLFQQPPGLNRGYASPRKYRLDLESNLVTEVWNYEMDQSILDPICSSIYEDAPLNYVVDYAFVGGFMATTPYAQLLGLDAAGKRSFTTSTQLIFATQPITPFRSISKAPASHCDGAQSEYLHPRKCWAWRRRPHWGFYRYWLRTSDHYLPRSWAVARNDRRKFSHPGRPEPDHLRFHRRGSRGER